MICANIIGYLDDNKKKDLSLDINQVIAHIHANYASLDFNVSSLADHFDMSISNFSHQFKSYMNQNVSSYINNIRINKAKNLITSTDLSIGEIASEIGYSQASSFIRMFKQAVGKTPGEYRIEYNENITKKE
ncbi:MAG: helix-turn-helix transcriptional regulator [Clostridiales bacterium]|nr:helix-turn-helix transcriptional regulator [Clostridiales bacterium]